MNGHKTTKIFYTMSYLQIQSLSSKGSITLFPAVSLSHRKKATSHHSNFLFMTKSKHKTKKKKKKKRYPFTTTSNLLLHWRRGPHPPCHCHETLWLGMEPPGSTSMTITNTTSINLFRSTMDGLDLLSEFFFPSFSWIRIWLWWIFWV